MKKLMILMLVLGLATVANAQLSGVQLSLNGVTNGAGNTTELFVTIGTEIVIDVYGPAKYNWPGYVIIEDNPATAAGNWGDDANSAGVWGFNSSVPGAAPFGDGYYEKSGYPVITANAGNMADVKRYVEWFPPANFWGFGYELGAAATPGNQVVAGEQFDFMYHQCGIGAVTITLWDESADPTFTTPQDTIIVRVPEPMTLALLGLGGLALLKRRA
jgi:hypothetical protein